MADDNFSKRAGIGQAYNLAVSTAIADGRHHDNAYIVKQFLRHLQFAALVQKATPEQLVIAVENPKVLELFEAINKELK